MRQDLFGLSDPWKCDKGKSKKRTERENEKRYEKMPCDAKVLKFLSEVRPGTRETRKSVCLVAVDPAPRRKGRGVSQKERGKPPEARVETSDWPHS